MHNNLRLFSCYFQVARIVFLEKKKMALRRQQCSSAASSPVVRRTVTGTTSKWEWPPASSSSGSCNEGGGGARTTGPWGGSLSALDRLEGAMAGSDANWPQTEAELASHYQSAIMDQQQRHLEPLREDLADWLNKTLGKSF